MTVYLKQISTYHISLLLLTGSIVVEYLQPLGNRCTGGAPTKTADVLVDSLLSTWKQFPKSENLTKPSSRTKCGSAFYFKTHNTSCGVFNQFNSQKTSNECKALSGERRCERIKRERNKKKINYFSLMSYGTKLESLALLHCIGLSIVLAL